MTRVLLLCMLLACALTARAAERALWTWESDSYALLQDPRAAADAIDFLRDKRIGIVYLYADAHAGRNLIVEDPDAYRRLIARLHRHDIRVYALLGSAQLHTEAYVLPAHRVEAGAMLQRVLDYNAAARPAQRFDGVNLDIEPHILDAWDQDRDALLLGFLDLGRALMALKSRSGQALPVGPAMPFWFDGIVLEWNGRSAPVSAHAQDLYDYVALMDYRDHAEGRDGILAHAGDEMDYADAHGKQVVIGVEVTPAEPAKVSFHHLREADLERELSLVEHAYASRPAFAGFAIHHYRGYRDWLSRPAPQRAEPSAD